MKQSFPKDWQYVRFCAYGFLKNLRFFEPFLILFFREKGISWVEIGSIYAIREIARNIFEIPSGVMADIVGRRKTLICSFLSYIVSFLIFYLFSSFPLYIIAIVFYGFGDAFRTGTHKAMIFEYLKLKNLTDSKVHYYGHTRSWSQRGSALTSLIAAYIVIFYGNYTVVFLISTVPYILDLVLIASYPKSLEGGYINKGNMSLKESFAKPMKDIKTALTKPGAIKCVLNVSIFSGYQKAIKDYIQPIIKSLAISYPLIMGLDHKQQTALFIGVLYFFIYLFTSYSSRQSGILADKKGTSSLNITLLGGFLTGIISGLFYGIQIHILAILFFIGIYIFENLRKPIGISYISERFDEKILASSLSMSSQTETVFSAIFAFLLGVFAELLDVKWAILALSGLLLFIIPVLRVKNGIDSK